MRFNPKDLSVKYVNALEFDQIKEELGIVAEIHKGFKEKEFDNGVVGIIAFC